MLKTPKNQAKSLVVVAHNIRSLHNVGSIFRSADVFAIDHLILTGYTGCPPRKEIAKVALQSEHRVSWEYQESVMNVLHKLQSEAYACFALEFGVGSVNISSFVRPDRMALVIGNEVLGVEQEILDQCQTMLSIPMQGTKQSLNVSVATGIAFYALTL